MMEGFRDTQQIQDFQSASSPGNNLNAMVEDEHPITEPFDETSIMDSPSVETQMVSLDVDTEVLDLPDFVDILKAQMVDDSEKEIVLDSDDEGIERNEVATVVKGLTCDETGRGTGHIAVETPDQDKKLLVPPKHCKSGHIWRRRSVIAAHSQSVEHAYCLAGGSLTDMASNYGPNSNHTDPIHETALSVNNAISTVEDQTSAVRNVSVVGHNSLQCSGKQSDLMDETEILDMETKAASNSDALDGKITTPVIVSNSELVKLSYVESQEPGDSSQAALDCVDNYLSVNNLNFSEKCKVERTNKIKSLPALNTKGFQSLARVANLRTKDGQSPTFEWDANQPDNTGYFFKRKEPLLGWKSYGLRSGSTPRLAKNLSLEEERNSIDHCKNVDLNLVDSRLIVHKSNQISEVRKAAEKASRTQCKQFDEHLDAETSRRQHENDSIERDVPDMDVGFDTQMAAEAIEALLYAPPPSNDANAHHGLENTFEDTPKCTTVNKFRSFSNADSSDSGATARQRKGAKRNSNKLSRNTSTSFQSHSKDRLELNLSLEVTNKVARVKSATDKRRTSITSSKASTRVKEDEFPEKENTKVVGNSRNSSRSVSYPLEELEESFRSFSPIVHRTRHRSLVESSKLPEDTTCDFVGKRCELGVDVVNRRKRSGLDRDTLLGVTRKRSKLSPASSVEGTNYKVNQKQQAILKLSTWLCPKRKRTRHNAPHLSELPNKQRTSSIVVNDESFAKNSGESCNEAERKLKTPCFSSTATLKARATPKFGYSSEEKYVESSSTGKFGEPSALKGQIARVNSAKAKASRMFSKLDTMDPRLSDVGTENRNDDLPDANVTTSTMPRSRKIYKQQCKRNSSKSPLLKELTRLGFAESLPDFTPKDLRRRRNMADIRVLFSQSLDDHIIQKQRKILARLGISTASDCSDATHFVTDRFVRSRKMMETIALGKPVVTPLWLESCSQAKSFIDEKHYILRDAKKEKELGFSMVVSLSCAKEHPLLKDRKVIVTSNVKPSKEMIECLVKAVQGQLVVLPRKKKGKSKDLLILSCEQDYGACAPFVAGGTAVYSSELLLNGIVIQKLEYERHRLFTDHANRNGSTICRN